MPQSPLLPLQQKQFARTFSSSGALLHALLIGVVTLTMLVIPTTVSMAI